VTPEFEELRKLSARVGSDPLLVQAAGGNTSIKQGNVMWIKASGTWLRDALAKDIFVPLDLPRLASALANDDPDCESCTPFVRADLNERGLRPSIETSVHGLMPQAVVVHVHCVSTIAHAICADAKKSLTGMLADFNWAWVPYARPGLQLSRAIRQNIRPGVDVLVLGNHGLAVAADTVSDADALLARVTKALHIESRPVIKPDLPYLVRFSDSSDFTLPHDIECHMAATEPLSVANGLQSAYYPDHVVFLGTEVPTELTSNAPAIAIPGKGVLVNKSAKPAIEPMLRCLGDVFRRVPKDAKLHPLTATDIDALLNWDAEKYRQTLQP
jgi:rhamnose utilization protein RhaD (predicted bifunctional aldolase and dehydrogenase)